MRGTLLFSVHAVVACERRSFFSSRYRYMREALLFSVHTVADSDELDLKEEKKASATKATATRHFPYLTHT